MPPSDLHRIQPLIDIFETALFTSIVPNSSPLSLILVGPSGSAKSKLLKSYGGPSIHQSDSVTTSGLFDIVQRDPKNEIKFIVIPDINPTMSRRAATVSSTVGNLLSITADGTIRTDDGRSMKEMKHDVVGLLTGCTPEIYDKHAKQWFALGLRRRIVPVFYRFSTGTINALQKLVRQGKIGSRPSQARDFIASGKPASISKTSALELERFSLQFSNNLGKLAHFKHNVKKWYVKEVVPIAPHVVLRSLAIAHATRRKASTVSNADMEFISMFLDFTDPESPKQI